jgi:hypothetical protein
MKRLASVFIGVVALAGVCAAGVAGYRAVAGGKGESCAPSKANQPAETRCPCGLCSDPECRCVEPDEAAAMLKSAGKDSPR